MDDIIINFSECIRQAAKEAGITLSEEQIAQAADTACSEVNETLGEILSDAIDNVTEGN